MALATNLDFTNAQISACLAVVNNVGNLSSNLEDAADETNSSAAGDMRTCAEVTLMNALDRLDSILKDDSRWTVPVIDGHTHYLAIATEQTRAAALANELKAQEVFAAEFNKQLALARFTQEPEVNPTQKKNAKRKK